MAFASPLPNFFLVIAVPIAFAIPGCPPPVVQDGCFSWWANGTCLTLLQSYHWPVGSQLYVKCDDGSTLVGNQNTTCLSTNRWSRPFGCEKRLCCLPPPPLENGYYLLRNMSLIGNIICFSPGSQLSVHCNSMFRHHGDELVSCSHSSKTFRFRTPPTCLANAVNGGLPRQCRRPSRIANGYYTTVDDLYLNSGQLNTMYPGATLKVNCDRGSQLVGTKFVTCSSNNARNSATFDSPGSCVRASCCLVPPAVVDGYFFIVSGRSETPLDVSNRTRCLEDGTKVALRCITDWNPRESTCQSDLEFRPPVATGCPRRLTPPTCCRRPQSLGSNGYYTLGDRVVSGPDLDCLYPGQELKIKCNPGLVLNGISSIRCYWAETPMFQTPGQCERRCCQISHNLSNGSYIANINETELVLRGEDPTMCLPGNETIRIRCDTGYELAGVDSFTCAFDNPPRPVQAQCVERSRCCQRPPRVANSSGYSSQQGGSVLRGDELACLSPGTQLFVRCWAGHRYQGSVIECRRNSLRFDPPGHCIQPPPRPTCCGKPPVIADSLGYSLPQNHDLLPDNQLDCLSPSTVLLVNCEDGYKYNGSSIQCHRTTLQFGPPGHCVAVPTCCRKPPFVPDSFGYSLSQSESLLQENELDCLAPGTFLTVRCKLGYTYLGNIIQCSDSLRFDPPGSCKRCCQRPPVIANSIGYGSPKHLLLLRQDQLACLAPGTFLFVYCKDGYIYTGNVIQCLPDTQQFDPPGRCEPLTPQCCPLPQPFSHGYLTLPDGQNVSASTSPCLAAGSSLQVHCDPGYLMDVHGSNVITCQTGTLNFETPGRCRPSCCQQPSPVRNGYFALPTGQRIKSPNNLPCLRAGDSLEVHCNDGYARNRRSRFSVITCDAITNQFNDSLRCRTTPSNCCNRPQEVEHGIYLLNDGAVRGNQLDCLQPGTSLGVLCYPFHLYTYRGNRIQCVQQTMAFDSPGKCISNAVGATGRGPD